MRISVIVPALNEASGLSACLSACPADPDVETIVADGGSLDETREVAARAGAKVVRSRPGRGPQMNAGAAEATGEALLFLHADTRLPDDAWKQVRDLLSDASIAGGAFRLAIDGPGWFYRFTSRNANLRSTLIGAPYGDQAFFVRKSAFDALGGYRDLSRCEDLEFIRRLRSQGRVVLAPAEVRTSARRWTRDGRIRVTVRNGVLFARYWLGLLEERQAAGPSRTHPVPEPRKPT